MRSLRRLAEFCRGMIVQAIRLFRYKVLRDESAGVLFRWFADNGDNTLRLSYELDEKSVVFDVGGYQGDFAYEMNARYGCTVYLFEPHPELFRQCEDRFRNNSKVIPLKYGLGAESGTFLLSDSANASTFSNYREGDPGINCEVKCFLTVIAELDIKQIDLMKLNIEGGEYPLLELVISKGIARMIKHYQVQFHDFIENASSDRDEITSRLTETHDRTWCYPFVWESWTRR